MSVAATKSKWLKDMGTFAKQRQRYNWKVKRQRDLKAQKEYFEDHPYCQVCLAEGRGRRLADEVHEIIYKSGGGKCEEDNFLSVCRNCHGRCHYLRRPFLEKEDLWKVKKLDIEIMQEKLRGIRRGKKNYECAEEVY